jgi:hypothetical protein
MPINRIKFKPPFDSPFVVTFETLSAAECRSQYNGMEYRYNVTNEGRSCFLYLTRQGHDTVQKLHPSAGDAIELLKYKFDGHDCFDARFAGAPPEPPPSNGPRMVAPLSRDGRANGQRYYLPREAEAPAAAPEHHHQAGAAAHQEPPAALRGTSPLARCLCAAIDASLEASEYGRSKNFSVAFLGSDIRAMANTLMIGDQRNGGGES